MPTSMDTEEEEYDEGDDVSEEDRAQWAALYEQGHYFTAHKHVKHALYEIVKRKEGDFFPEPYLLFHIATIHITSEGLPYLVFSNRGLLDLDKVDSFVLQLENFKKWGTFILRY